MDEEQRVFHVVWEIDLHADDPEHAARLALEIQRDPDSIATVFAVSTEDGATSTTVDLDEEEW